MKRAIVIVTALAAAGCGILPGEPETGSEALCIATLQFGGVLFTQIEPSGEGGFEPGEVVGQVTRQTGCNDTPDPGDEPSPAIMSDGDSNFLLVGTEIHSVDGYGVQERLAVHNETEWLLLGPIETLH